MRERNMTSESRDPNGSKWILIRRWLPTFLLVSWALGTAAIWTLFAVAPAGVLATADAGNLVAIQGSKVTTTRGFFHVFTKPSAMAGVPVQVIRTNSPWSDTGLQLCTVQIEGGTSWCSDISDGYAGKLADTVLAQRAWSRGAMIAVFCISLALTLFGWIPAAATAISAATEDAPATREN